MAISVPLYTVDDLEHFPDDGNRYELLDGVLLVTPQASAPHQVVAHRISVELAISLQKTGLAQVVSPGAVVQLPRTQLQPDILVYPARFSPATDWRKITEHWLAVEVFSRSSRMYDREFKRDAYFALGVQHVWLIDWHERFVEVCSADETSRIISDAIHWHVAGVDVVIDLREVFAGLP
ncbi:MAG TPA: Uma2 family endonuclease [Gemmatimonadaceae bacterium]|nr:Uma2 family endonuclease [Gemmatimonadaceae bacterium]